MPRAERRLGPGLDIQLDNIGRPYQPGDVITGRVLRRAHAVSPRATVTIQLLGRAKSKIIVSKNNGNGRSRSYYRGRFDFFDAAQTRRQLHDGPIHIPPGASSGVWEFAIDVPLSPSPRAVVRQTHNPKNSLLSLDPNDIASCPLPSSFATHGDGRNTRFECYVEYHLEASLLQQGSHGGTVTASLPIQLRAKPMPYPLSNFDLKRYSWARAVDAYRLVPGMENAALSFKQKAQQILHSSKVPRLGFTVECFCPAVVQLENPTPIPFLLRIIPERRRTSEVLHGVPQTARLRLLELILKADTGVIAPGRWGTQAGDDTIKHIINVPVAIAQGASYGETAESRQEHCVPHTTSRDDEKTTNEQAIPEDATHHDDNGTESSAGNPRTESFSEELPTYTCSTKEANTNQYGPVFLPCGWGAEEMPLDVGTAVGLQLCRTHASAFGRPIPGTVHEPISPSFTTYCIRHTHRLKWKMVIEVSRESVKLEGEQDITVMGPSEV